MKIKIEKRIKSSKGLLVVPVFQEDLKNLPSAYPAAVKSFIKDRIKDEDFKAKTKNNLTSYLSVKGLPAKLLVVGMGKKEKYNATSARNLGGRIGKYGKSSKVTEITTLLIPEMTAFAEDFIGGLLTAQYDLGIMKDMDNKKGKYELKALHFVLENKPGHLEESLRRGEIIAHSVEFVQDLVNLPSNVVDSNYMEREARRIAKENGYKKILLGKKELQKMKAGGILAVNQGCQKDPKLLVLQYDGAKDKKEKPIVIVGKGVIFDTGGYSLKPCGAMETMQQDMAGGATVLGIFEVLKKLKIQRNVVGVVPVVENLVNENAYKPSDIITMLSGNTVEVTNTDAEGRLILADSLYYSSKMDPELIISIATLTGAVAVALGDRYAGVLGNNADLMENLKQAGEETDELVWQLPIHDDYSEKMKSKVADFTNYDPGSGRYAGTAKAAAFLEFFVDKKNWFHIDIGGTAFTTDPKDYQTKGATAHGLRVLLRFLERGV